MREHIRDINFLVVGRYFKPKVFVSLCNATKLKRSQLKAVHYFEQMLT